jgi:hypothetical protein
VTAKYVTEGAALLLGSLYTARIRELGIPADLDPLRSVY